MTLQNILDATRAESQVREHKYPPAVIQRELERMGPTRGLARALREKPFSVIAEIKRESPSMGRINSDAIQAAHEIYSTHPVVSAISVLTQNAQFGGSMEDLETMRKLTQSHPKPILRKDFIFSEYEILFSRWIGADAILLMASVVDDKATFKRFHDLAVSIGLDVLCEVHDAAEIELLPDTVKICGINSRRFKGVAQKQPIWLKLQHSLFGATSANRDTQTDLAAFDLFERLEAALPAGCLKIAESGISADNVDRVLRKYRFNAALIGTSLLKSRNRQAMIAALDKIQSEADAVCSESSPGSPLKRRASYAV